MEKPIKHTLFGCFVYGSNQFTSCVGGFLLSDWNFFNSWN